MSLQIQCLARDGGEPSRTDTTTVYINVQRNNLPPVFITVNRTGISVCEEQALGEGFEFVQAADQDATVKIQHTYSHFSK